MSHLFELTSGNNRVTLDPQTGHIRSLRLGEEELIQGSDLPGPFRLCAPLEDFAAHTIDGHRTKPEIIKDGDTLICRYAQVQGKRGPIAIAAEVEIRATGDGAFELRCSLTNRSDLTIEQVFFPWIAGLAQIDGPDDRITWGRSTFYPWKTWGNTADRNLPKFLNYLSRPHVSLHCGEPYKSGMKWMDFSGQSRGVSLYSKDTSAKTQFMFADTPTWGAMTLDLSWYTYPFIKPGQTWESATFVLDPHAADWRHGVLRFKAFAEKAFTPTPSPPALDDTIGQFTLWIAWHFQDWQDVKYRFTDIPGIAAEAREAGFNQMTVVRATALDFCLPHVIREPLGTAAELKEAIGRARELGVNVIPFITCRLIRPSTVAPAERDEWFKEDVAGGRQYSNWSYDPTMVPTMPVRQNGARAAFVTCSKSKAWRKAFFDNLEMMAEQWDIRGFLFDVSFDWDGMLCFNPLHAHATPDEEPQLLADTLRESRERLVKKFGPDHVVLSGEGQWDVVTQFQDLTWDWAPVNIEEAFDMAFPRARTCTKCTGERNQINTVFASGRLIDLYVEDGGARLGEHPQLTAYLKTLAAFKQKFAACLAQRDAYLRDLFVELDPLEAESARVHRHGDEALVMIVNTAAKGLALRAKIDLKNLLGSGTCRVEAWSRTGEKLSTSEAQDTAVVELKIPAEDFVGVHVKR